MVSSLRAGSLSNAHRSMGRWLPGGKEQTAVTELPLIARARGHGEWTAILAPEGAFTCRQLLDASARVAACLLDGSADLHEARVAFLTPPGFEYAAVQWGI